MKPTVFISHSSHDDQILNALRDLLAARTSSAIDLFLSTDGQSIPLGRNWVHRIERALDEARLMLVFLTPSSVKSQWIYFEAGYAYSKGVRVVPIGALGVDLSQLHPPLSLLQGFNLRDADGMNNILAVLNQEFGFTFPEAFTENDFSSVFGSVALTDTPFAFLDNVVLIVSGEPERLIEAARTQFRAGNLHFDDRQSYITSFGISISAYKDTIPRNSGIRVELDAQAFRLMLPVLDAILAIDSNRDAASAHFAFLPIVRRIAPFQKLTARLIGCNVKFGDREAFELENVQVTVGVKGIRAFPGDYETATVSVRFTGTLSGSPIFRLLQLLFERGILYLGV